MNDIKFKITQYVDAYRTTFRDEYAQFIKGQKIKLDLRKDKYAETGQDFVVRKLGEIPETLYAILKTRLTDTEFDWFRSTPGSRWFFKEFSEYRETEKV